MSDSERLDNGVRKRADGKGDGWANAHRDVLGTKFLMQDVDGYFGFLVYGDNTGERLFLEYVPDDYANRTKPVRSFAIVAMFDRKTTMDAATSEENALSRAFYLWLCRTIGRAQPAEKQPRFYFVVGGQQPPWDMLELDILTGERIGDIVHLANADWPHIWETLGLAPLRRSLLAWLQGRA